MRPPPATTSPLSTDRGLPFGTYTGTEILDTLEAVAHERYEELLPSQGVMESGRHPATALTYWLTVNW